MTRTTAIRVQVGTPIIYLGIEHTLVSVRHESDRYTDDPKRTAVIFDLRNLSTGEIETDISATLCGIPRPGHFDNEDNVEERITGTQTANTAAATA